MVKSFIKRLEKSKMHFSQSTSWSRNSDNGFNDGLTACVKEIENVLTI